MRELLQVPYPSLIIPKPYDFAASICDHGWPMLAPFAWDAEHKSLQRVELLDTGRVVLLRLTAQDEGNNVQLQVAVKVDQDLTAAEVQELEGKLRWMLKLDEDLDAFYAIAAHHNQLSHVAASGRGRLLRAPTLWEDVVKTICTTNVSWRNTVSMVQRLVAQLGAPLAADPARCAFPTPQQVAAVDPALFDKEIRLGYRNGYVIQLAQEIAEGRRDLEALKQNALPGPELRQELRSIKGVGDYAANTLLVLLGHYHELPVDSAFRSHVKTRHFAHKLATDAPPTDAEMAAMYDQWGDWKALGYWFEAGE